MVPSAATDVYICVYVYISYALFATFMRYKMTDE